MRRATDEQILAASKRALETIGRAEIESMAFPEIDVEISFRAPSPEEYYAYLMAIDPASRGSSRFNLLASCLVYPCLSDGKPDIVELGRMVEELPAIPRECIASIDDMACGGPVEIFDLNASTAHRLSTPYKATRRAKAVKIVDGTELVLCAPSRPTFDDYDALDKSKDIPEKAYAACIDCIVNIDDDAKRAVLKKYPGLPTLLTPHIFSMAGITGGMTGTERRKKVRRAG